MTKYADGYQFDMMCDVNINLRKSESNSFFKEILSGKNLRSNT